MRKAWKAGKAHAREFCEYTYVYVHILSTYSDARVYRVTKSYFNLYLRRRRGGRLRRVFPKVGRENKSGENPRHFSPRKSSQEADENSHVCFALGIFLIYISEGLKWNFPCYFVKWHLFTFIDLEVNHIYKLERYVPILNNKLLLFMNIIFKFSRIKCTKPTINQLGTN